MANVLRPDLKVYENYPTHDEDSPDRMTFGFGAELTVVFIQGRELHVDPQRAQVFVEGARPRDGWLPISQKHPFYLRALKMVDESRWSF